MSGSITKTSGLSFCVITHGKEGAKIRLALESIRRQKQANAEILVVGNYREGEGYRYLPAVEEANQGRLGAMRNRAVREACHDHLVILDDDMILTPDWSAEVVRHPEPWDILTSRVRLPDGTRYWDHATFGGPRKQILLDPEEIDDHVYMSGGAAWVMKARVAETVVWDPDLTFYQEEDIAFSRRCQAAGFQIQHNPGSVAYHYSSTYTRLGRLVKNRAPEHSHLWLLEREELEHPDALLALAMQQAKADCFGDFADCMRAGMARFPDDERFAYGWNSMVAFTGGEVTGDRWYLEGDPYFKFLLEELDPEAKVPGGYSFSATEIQVAEEGMQAWMQGKEFQGKSSPALAALLGIQVEMARNRQDQERLAFLGKMQAELPS